MVRRRPPRGRRPGPAARWHTRPTSSSGAGRGVGSQPLAERDAQRAVDAHVGPMVLHADLDGVRQVRVVQARGLLHLAQAPARARRRRRGCTRGSVSITSCAARGSKASHAIVPRALAQQAAQLEAAEQSCRDSGFGGGRGRGNHRVVGPVPDWNAAAALREARDQARQSGPFSASTARRRRRRPPSVDLDQLAVAGDEGAAHRWPGLRRAHRCPVAQQLRAVARQAPGAAVLQLVVEHPPGRLASVFQLHQSVDAQRLAVAG